MSRPLMPDDRMQDLVVALRGRGRLVHETVEELLETRRQLEAIARQPTTTMQPRFDHRNLDGMTTSELIDVQAELVSARDAATGHPIVHQALALRVYQIESAIAVRNGQVMADIDDAAEQRTVARIVEWLRDRSWVRDGDVDNGFVASLRHGIARRIEDGAWRSR